MSKRSVAEYEKEADNLAKRIKMNPQYDTTKSKDSKTWFDFLENVIKINPVSIGRGSDFFETARQKINPTLDYEPEYTEKAPEFRTDYRTKYDREYRQESYEKYSGYYEQFD